MKIFYQGLDERMVEYLTAHDFKLVPGHEDQLPRIPDHQYDALVICFANFSLAAVWIKSFRDDGFNTPVIGISGEKVEYMRSEHRAKFLEQGGDYFLCSPVNPRELAASLLAILRRKRVATSLREHERIGISVEFSLDSPEVRLNGKIIRLTASERKLFKVFADQPGKVLSQEDLMRGIQSEYREYLSGPGVLHASLYRIRQKLQNAGLNAWEVIQTVRGGGYRLGSFAS